MKKISITEIHLPPADFKNGTVNNLPKDRILLNWLIHWIEEGLNKNLFNFGDIIPSKKDFAKYHNVSTGTMQNAVRYAEDLGYFKSRQCVGTMIADKNVQNEAELPEKSISKKDGAVFKIKKYIIEQKFKKGDILPSARIIANEIDTSQNTARLALDVLVREGILVQNVTTLNKTTKILNLDYKDIQVKKSDDDTKEDRKSVV